MTLHWWMHWFWVTLLIITASSGTSSAPQSEELQHITTDTAEQPSVRQGRAMYFSKTQPSTKPTPLPENNTDTPDLHVIPKVNQTNITEIVHPGLQPIEWTAVNATDDTVNVANVSLIDAHILTVNVTANNTVNNTDVAEQNTTFDKRRNLTRPDSVKEATIEGVAESRIVTEKPLSLETTFLQTRIPTNIESYRRVVDNDNGMDTGAIAGISFAALVLVALAGSTAFVMYRRRYLNKPQTLNDKCSNPDSSGYLDDSTIRDNSEEMYSLDNDSFLNSLEAMTIQNYWTDTVKHTKL